MIKNTMNEKLYIRKEKVDIRIMSFAICVFVMWIVRGVVTMLVALSYVAAIFWKDTKMFMECTGSVRTALDSRRDEYAEIMEKVKYVPVFVDVIRVIDNRLYKKEDW